LENAGFEVVTAADGAEALDVARGSEVALVLLDVCLPGLSGYEVLHSLRDVRPTLPVLLVSGERVESFDRTAGLLLGADDYLVKPFAPDELLARVRALLRRGSLPERATVSGLTTRELQVLTHLADGLSQAEIASRLVISPKTVGTHLEHIFRKLGVRTRAQAVATAYREGLVSTSV